MSSNILSELERLREDTSLSEHRLGMLVANNGRLFERIREGRRMWPETVEAVRDGIRRVRAERVGSNASGSRP